MGSETLDLVSLTSRNADTLALIAILVTLVLYNVFAILAYKQVGVLNKAIQTESALLLNLLAAALVLAGLALLVLASFQLIF